MSTAGKLLNCALALICVNATANATEKLADVSKPASAPQSQQAPRADNSNMNDRDKGGATKTPQDQSNKEQDRELLAAVRRAIVGDKSLSVMAHNVKVLAENGAVTLRGPVKSAEERAKVLSHAKQVRGVMSTDNQLDVKSSASDQ